MEAMTDGTGNLFRTVMLPHPNERIRPPMGFPSPPMTDSKPATAPPQRPMRPFSLHSIGQHGLKDAFNAKIFALKSSDDKFTPGRKNGADQGSSVRGRCNISDLGRASVNHEDRNRRPRRGSCDQPLSSVGRGRHTASGSCGGTASVGTPTPRYRHASRSFADVGADHRRWPKEHRGLRVLQCACCHRSPRRRQRDRACCGFGTEGYRNYGDARSSPSTGREGAFCLRGDRRSLGTPLWARTAWHTRR
jgi:hypothetical protein